MLNIKSLVVASAIVMLPFYAVIGQEAASNSKKTSDGPTLGWSFNLLVAGAMQTKKVNDESETDTYNKEKPEDGTTDILPVVDIGANYRISEAFQVGLQVGVTTNNINAVYTFDNPISPSDKSNASVVLTFLQYGYWENPYLVGEEKKDMSGMAPKLSVSVDNLGPVKLTYSAYNKTYDDDVMLRDATTDIVGQPMSAEDLKRSGSVSTIEAVVSGPVYDSDAIALNLSGGYSQEEGKFEGEASSYTNSGFSGSVGVSFKKILNISLEMKDTTKEYKKENPYFREQQKDNIKNISLGFEIPAWDKISVVVKGILDSVESNIDYFDSETQTYVLGATFAF